MTANQYTIARAEYLTKAAESKAFLSQYRICLDFCIKAKEKAMDQSAKEFAQWFKPSGL